MSGETGLPVIEHVDQAIQSEDADCLQPLDHHGNTSEHGIFTNEQNQFDSKDQESILPLHLTVSNEPPCDEESENKDTRRGNPSDNGQLPEGVQIKVEEVTETQGTCMLSETLDTSAQNTEPQGYSDFQGDLSMDTSGSVPTDSMQEEETSVGTFTMPMSPKPYQCAMCGKAFRSVQVLQKHTQTFHFRGQASHSLSRGKGRGHSASVKR